MAITARVEQRRKGPKAKQLVCVKPRFESKEAAKAYIEKLKNKGERGTARLHAFTCPTCSRPRKEVIHVGHRRKVEY